MKLRHFMALFALWTVAVSCGNESASSERPLTPDEADRLASVLYTNYQAGVATFNLSSAFTGTGDTLSMSGVVDWTNHTGQASVTASGQESGITEVIWNQKLVVERRPALDDVLAGLGHPGVRYVYRPVDTANRQLDRAISILIGLAATQRENAVLILQKPGSAFLRKDRWQGRVVDVIRYGSQNRFWLEQGSSVLRRFDGNAAVGSAPIVIDFLQTGARTVTPPPREMVIDVDEIKEAYAAVASG